MKQTIFRTVIGGVISRKRASLAIHALVALLLVPKLLRPGKSQVTKAGILPNKRSQLARYCLVWGIHLVYSLDTAGQVTIKVFYQLWSGPPCIFFVLFVFKYDVQVPI